MALLAPHFDLPFRISGKSFAQVEQDSNKDVANCVETIIRTPLGFRDDAPDFGFPEIEFLNMPIGTSELVSLLSEQEPRARILMEESPDLVDQLVDNLQVNTSGS